MTDLAATPIINSLRQQAATILATSLGSATVEPFNTTGLGNFPYTWQDPTNLRFNQKTYAWIQSGLQEITVATSPVEQSGIFSNAYNQAISAISYSYSTADQVKVNKGKAQAEQQQAALLSTWTESGFVLPPGNQPLDGVLNEIQQNWATPPTSLQAMQSTRNLTRLLNKTPASGQNVIPQLSSWLVAIGSIASLINDGIMNQGLLTDVQAAVQDPGVTNGGIPLNDANSTMMPAWTVSQAVSEIQNSLQNKGSKIVVAMDVSQASASEFKVSVHGGTGFAIPFLDFFSLGVGASASYFKDTLTKSGNTVCVKMIWTGPTLVQYEPLPYNQATRLGWCYMTPIRDAIKNGTNADVSGFKFAPDPQIDFGKFGTFGYTTGAAIANYPSVEITVTSADFKSIEQTFQQSASSTLSFLGIPLASATESTYSHSTQVDASNSSVTITLTPPPSLVATSGVDAQGWILGVIVDRPAATA
jgi:hypothetical protein